MLRTCICLGVMWISAAFNLKVIRTFDTLHAVAPSAITADRIQAGVILLESAFAHVKPFKIRQSLAPIRSCSR